MIKTYILLYVYIVPLWCCEKKEVLLRNIKREETLFWTMYCIGKNWLWVWREYVFCVSCAWPLFFSVFDSMHICTLTMRWTWFMKKKKKSKHFWKYITSKPDRTIYRGPISQGFRWFQGKVKSCFRETNIRSAKKTCRYIQKSCQKVSVFPWRWVLPWKCFHLEINLVQSGAKKNLLATNTPESWS